MKRARNQGGQALIEVALTIPLLLLIAVAIFEFGRAYQTWEILTNAAREGARVAVLPAPAGNSANVMAVVRNYMQQGRLSKWDTAQVTVNNGDTIAVNGTAVSASRVTINYPFDFIVLKPVALLVPGTSSAPGDPITMQASALMRNEM